MRDDDRRAKANDIIASKDLSKKQKQEYLASLTDSDNPDGASANATAVSIVDSINENIRNGKDLPEGTTESTFADQTGVVRAKDIHKDMATKRAQMGGNPNGSCGNIAGVLNENKNVLGMMPHPERASDIILGSDDGLHIFNSILENS